MARMTADTMRWRQLGAIAMLLLPLVIAMGCAYGDDIPANEQLAQEIGKGVMCPVCPGESIDQSQHPLAVQMRAIVADKLEEGWTAPQIRSYFVESYGPSVLLEPPSSGINRAVWLVPPAAIAVAAVVLFLTLRLMVRPETAGDGEAASSRKLTDEERAIYLARIEEARGREDGGLPGEFDEQTPAPSEGTKT